MRRHNRKSLALLGILGMVSLLILAGVSLARNPELSQIREDLGQFREKISPVLLDEVKLSQSGVLQRGLRVQSLWNRGGSSDLAISFKSVLKLVKTHISIFFFRIAKEISVNSCLIQR